MPDSSSDQPQSASELFHAIESGDASRVAKTIAPQFFTLLEVSDGAADEDEYSALMAEVDDFPVLVAFTSEDHAGDFAGAMVDLFAGDEDVPAFIVDGRNLLAHLPAEHGVLLNPESDDCHILPPDLVALVAAELGGE